MFWNTFGCSFDKWKRTKVKLKWVKFPVDNDRRYDSTALCFIWRTVTHAQSIAISLLIFTRRIPEFPNLGVLAPWGAASFEPIRLIKVRQCEALMSGQSVEKTCDCKILGDRGLYGGIQVKRFYWHIRFFKFQHPHYVLQFPDTLHFSCRFTQLLIKVKKS